MRVIMGYILCTVRSGSICAPDASVLGETELAPDSYLLERMPRALTPVSSVRDLSRSS